MCSRGVTFFLILLTCGCTSLEQSLLLYRLPYANGTDVEVTQDHLTHSGSGPGRFDLKGVNGGPGYVIVAAQTGIVELIEDGFSGTGSDPTVPNNYVWISHSGGEWTNYTHLAQDSVRDDAGLSVGDAVTAGQFIGIESDVGSAGGCEHLHFEVRVPNDPDDPLTGGVTGNIHGIYRIARFCGVPGHIVRQDDIHESSACVHPAPLPD